MVHESRRYYDTDRNRGDREYRDARRDRPERRESSWDDDGRQNTSGFRPPERARTWERTREPTREPPKEPRSDLSSPTTSASARHDASMELFPNRQPASTAPKQPPSAPSSGPSARTIKSILDLITQRGFWYLRGEEAEKNRKRAHNAYEKCRLRPSDFGGSLEFLEQQKKGADEEKAKVDTRMGDIDDKLRSHLDQLFQKLKPEANNQATPATPTIPAAVDQAGLEARLIAAKASMKQEVKEMLAKESEEINRKVENFYESRVSVLQDSLAQESKRNTLLEQKLLELERRMEELRDERSPTINDTDMNMDGMPSINDLDELTKRQGEQISRLSTRLDCIEASLSQMQNLAKQVDDHGKAIKQQTDKQTESDTALVSLQSAISKLPTDKLENIIEDLANIKAKGQRIGTSLAPTSGDMVLQIIQPELTKVETTMRDSVNGIQQKLIPFLESERVSRGALEERVDEVANRILELRNDVDGIKAEKSEITKSMDELSERSVKHAKDLTHVTQEVMSANLHLDGLKRDIKSSFDGFGVQLQNMNAWQSNFDTRPLYKDIVNHISATLPEGVTKQLRALTTRVESVENQFRDYEAGATKKRKLQNGSPAVANGYH